MLHYEDFEQVIKAEAEREFELWRHILPAIPTAYRYRFAYTIKKGMTLPLAFDLVMLSQSLKDNAFEDFLNDAISAKLEHPETLSKLSTHVNKGTA